jgi:hypothetical protein
LHNTLQQRYHCRITTRQKQTPDMKKTDNLIALLVIAAIFGAVYYWIASSAIHEWKEEVKLADGRIIVVEQKRRFDGRVARESWLDLSLPESGGKTVEWHESLLPLVLNVSAGKLYLVARPPSSVEQARYGNPRRGYVAFQWADGKWKTIPFEDVPTAIYDSNMLIWPVPSNESRTLTLAEKNGTDYNGNAKLPPELKRLLP